MRISGPACSLPIYAYPLHGQVGLIMTIGTRCVALILRVRYIKDIAKVYFDQRLSGAPFLGTSGFSIVNC